MMSSRRYSTTRLTITVTILAAIYVSKVNACIMDHYDRDVELRAIEKGLSEVNLTARDRSEIEKLLEIASISPSSLGYKGIRAQEKARGEVLAKLGIERTPAKPKRELEALRLSLAKSPDAKGEELVSEAERLWQARNYDEAVKTLRAAIDLLHVHVFYPRC
jgi:hypothetical protein